MILSLRLILFISILLITFNPDIVYPDTKQDIEKEYSAGNILGFTKYLISKEEFYRAFVELKRLDSYYPGYVKKENIFTTELFLLYKGNRYSEILSEDFNTTDSNTKAIHSIFKTDVLHEKSEFISAKKVLDSAGFTGINKDLDLYLYKRTVLSYLFLKQIDKAREIIDNRTININDTGFNNAGLTELIDYSKNCFDSLKKPYKAMLFGIIPGMGYAYAGERATGVIAFVLISVLSGLTYYSFKTDNKPIGIFIGAAMTFFYGGSVIGGYLTAKKYNNSAMMDLNHSLSAKMRLAEDRERIYNEYGVGNAGE